MEQTLTNSAPTKIPDHLKHEICKRLAAFIGPTAIRKWLKAGHSIELSKPGILHYRDSDKWTDQFARYRAEWQAGTRDRLRLANVGGRVEELTKLYQDAYKRYEKASADSKRAEARHCQEILEQIQSELPGTEVAGGGGVVNINLPDNVRQGLGLQPEKAVDEPTE